MIAVLSREIKNLLDRYSSVRLHWFQSPYMGETNDHPWLFDVVFASPDDELHKIPISWGSLPLFRLNSVYSCPDLMLSDSLGDNYSFSFDTDVKLSVSNAGSNVSKSLYPLLTHENLREQVVVIQNDHIKVVIPCIEVLRFFFGLNKTLLYEILRPDSLNGLCTALCSETTSINFTARMPEQALNSEVAQRIAMIMCDASWSDSWHGVWNFLNRSYARSRKNAALTCKPPLSSSTTWRIRAIKHNNLFFAFEILSVQMQRNLPFRKVRYSHPAFVVYRRDRNNSVHTKNHQVHVKAGSVEMSQGSSGISRPVIVRHGSPSLSFLTKPDIVRVTSERIGAKSGPRCGNIQTTDGNAKIVNFSDEGGFGDAYSGEFVPVHYFVGGDTSKLSPHLASFLEALKSIYSFYIRIQIALVPESLSIATLNGQPRYYVLAEIQDPLCYLLELDLSDEHEMSTLFLAPHGEITEIAEMTESILMNAALRGSWSTEALSERKITYKLIRHGSLNSRKWARRIQSHLLQYARGLL